MRRPRKGGEKGLKAEARVAFPSDSHKNGGCTCGRLLSLGDKLRYLGGGMYTIILAIESLRGGLSITVDRCCCYYLRK